MNHLIAQGLIILILINSILSSNVIEDGFPTSENNSNKFASNAESRDEEGQTPRQDLAEEGKTPGVVTSRSIEVDHKLPLCLATIVIMLFPFQIF